MKEKKKNPAFVALKAAFPNTIPIMAGFLFLGITYGIYMNTSGFSFVYPMIMSLVIFGGSLEFVAVQMLLSTFAPLQTLLMSVMIQARHLFYGIAMLDKYKGTGWKKPYLIFGMCDESFSINCSAKIPEGVDKGWFFLWVTALNQLYWFVGATTGGLLGSLITFNTEGLDFVMTAMFVVIFLDQWLKERRQQDVAAVATKSPTRRRRPKSDRRHYTALIGVGASAVCLVIFGADSFMVPTMACILCLLTVFRKPIAKSLEGSDDK